jgi:DNA-directed RNA polymerase alpha subunit
MRGFQMELYGGPGRRQRRKPQDPYWVQYIPPEERQKLAEEKKLNKSLADCGFPSRIINVFEKAGIFTVKELITKSEEELKLLSSIGEVTLAQCVKLLDKLQIKWINRHS